MLPFGSLVSQVRHNYFPCLATNADVEVILSRTASGKSTLACALELELLQKGKRAFRLDGDNVRFGLNKDLGFSPKDREENIRRVGEVSSFSPLPNKRED